MAEELNQNSLLDDTTTWADFGKRHLDRRISKALTVTLGLERPTLVQSRGIPVALEGKDLLCRARTGSGKTLCFAVPLVQRLLVEAEKTGSRTPLAGLVLVPTKELVVQVHSVITALLTFCYELLTTEALLSGQKHLKAELPTILVTTPSSAMALVQQKQGMMLPMSETLKILVIDEADLMFSFGYETDMRSLCAVLPSTYQAMLFSATLSEEVEQLKGLMLHKPVTLKLEEPRVTGKLSQFYLVCHPSDKYLIMYTLIKLKLVQSKILVFVRSVEAAYRAKIVLERLCISSAVLHSELPHASRQNTLQAFNQGIVELLIATDDGLGHQVLDEDQEESAPPEELEENNQEDAAASEKGKKSKKKKKKADQKEGAAVTLEGANNVGAAEKKWRQRPQADGQYSMSRGVDLRGVSTVINLDAPTTVRDYVHRVGRCARGGASGTALTLCVEDDQPVLARLIRAQMEPGGESALKRLPMQISDAERFRYRVEDVSRGLHKKSIMRYRTLEVQAEALHSEKLQSYFEENPEEKEALQIAHHKLREGNRVRQHLSHVPSYLVPEHFTAATPVQQAVREVAAAGGPVSSAVEKRRRAFAQSQDVVHGDGEPPRKKGRKHITREMMLAKERRLNPETVNIEALPPISRKKISRLRRGKSVRPYVDAFGERRRRTPGEKSRKRKFGF